MLIVCSLVLEPEWTEVRPNLKKDVCILTAASGNVQVYNGDIGCSNNFFACVELGRANSSRKEKHIITMCRLDRFAN